jgi:hypothetical protein
MNKEVLQKRLETLNSQRIATSKTIQQATANLQWLSGAISEVERMLKELESGLVEQAKEDESQCRE